MIKKKIVLKEWQEKHYKDLDNILNERHGMIDTSTPGAGKTFTASKFSIEYGLKLMSISPALLTIVWNEMRIYGVNFLCDPISYSSLGSRKVKGVVTQPKHGYLTVEDDDVIMRNKNDDILFDKNGDVKTKRKIKFTPTKKYLKAVEEGIFLVFDEFHHLKNGNDQNAIKCWKACYALIKAITDSAKGISRYIFLSGSPMSKGIHLINYLRLMGYITYPQLSKKNFLTGKKEYLGVQEVINLASAIDAKLTNEMVANFKREKESDDNIIIMLYSEIIKNSISAAMTPIIHAKHDVKDGFYEPGKNNERSIKLAYENLDEAYKSFQEKELSTYARINEALMGYEAAMIPIFYRVVVEALTKFPSCKVIVFLNYVNNGTLLELVDMLYEFHPLLMYGSVKMDERPEIINKFNAPNLRYRLLLANIATGGEGLSFHDKTGKIPRIMFISTSYKYGDLYQSIFRTYRPDTLGIATIRNVYSSKYTNIKIINALGEKHDSALTMLDPKAIENVPMPGKYNKLFEVDNDANRVTIKTIMKSKIGIEVTFGKDWYLKPNATEYLAKEVNKQKLEIASG